MRRGHSCQPLRSDTPISSFGSCIRHQPPSQFRRRLGSRFFRLVPPGEVPLAVEDYLRPPFLRLLLEIDAAMAGRAIAAPAVLLVLRVRHGPQAVAPIVEWVAVDVVALKGI